MKARRFPALSIYRPLSEHDLVEKTRKQLQRRRMFAWFCLAWLVLAVPLLLYLMMGPFVRAVERLPSEAQDLGWAAVLGGFVFGGWFGPFMMAALMGVLEGFELLGFGRRDRLLVKYHDALQQPQPPKDAGIRESEAPGS